MPLQLRWQDEYGKKYMHFFMRPDLAQDFYARRESAWLFTAENLERILGYFLSRFFLDQEIRESLHANCMEEVLVALYEARCQSTEQFEQEALRLSSNSASRAIYAQKKNWDLEQRTIPYEILEEQTAKPLWDLTLYHKLFDAASHLQASLPLEDRRARRLLTQADLDTMDLRQLKLLVLYLLVVLLQSAKASKLERRALIGAFLLGDDDEITSQKISKRTRHEIQESNVRKARSKGLGKLKQLIESAQDARVLS